MSLSFNPLLILVVTLVGALTASASGEGVLYGVSGPENSFYQISTDTGVARLVGGTGFVPPRGVTAPPVALASDSERGIVWAFLNNTDDLYTVDLATGEITSVSTLSIANLVNVGLAYDSGNQLMYLSDLNTDILYSCDPEVGLLTVVGRLPDNISGMAFDSTNDRLYGVTGATDELYLLSTETGAATLIGNLGFDVNASGLAFDPERGTLYLTELNQDALYTLNTKTGEATLVGKLRVDNLAGLTFLAVEDVELDRIPITSVAREAMEATIGFEGVIGEEYALFKSLDLEFSDPALVDQVILRSGSGTLTDESASEEKAFYRVSLVQ